MPITTEAFGPFTSRVLREGSGPPLLYLHGFEQHPGGASFLRRFASEHAVFAPECPGYGESVGADALESPLDLVLFYRELLTRWGVQQVDVVGHSLGGMFAAELAALAPDLVRRLVLVDAYGLWLDDAQPVDPFVLTVDQLRAAKWHDEAAAANEASIFEPDPDDRFLLPVTRNQNLSTATRFLWPIPDRGLRKRLPYIKAATLVVHGASDGLVPLGHAEELARLVPDAALVVIPDAGHLPMFEQEDAFVDAVLGFLRER